MLVPQNSQELYVERNATAALAILALAAFMDFTAVLLILDYDRVPEAQEPPTQELPSN
jgi:hypothetical protein